MNLIETTKELSVPKLTLNNYVKKKKTGVGKRYNAYLRQFYSLKICGRIWTVLSTDM